MAKVRSNKIKDSFGDKVLNLITAIVLFLIIIVVGYPIIYVISSSFSSTAAISAGKVVLLPVDFSLDAYKFVLEYKQVWIGFRNSVFYTVIHVFLHMFVTILVAFPLSRKNFQGRGVYTMIFYASTRFSAGLIATFIWRCQLGFFDSIWAVIINGLIGVSDILILRTCFQSTIPSELYDSAMIDGCNYFQMIWKIALPLSKATLSVLILYTIVAQWNEYFVSMLYLRDSNLYPLQLVLRPIMQAAQGATPGMDTSNMSSASAEMANKGLEGVRYALIVISSTPVIVAYFCVQKSFKTGVMVGSVKG